MNQDKNGMSIRESFAFGLYTCAECSGDCFKKRITRTLKRPIFADVKETEVLFPAGRHSFHKECWDTFRRAFLLTEEGLVA